MTPLGRPVVPLEYGSATTSCRGLIGTDGGVGGAWSSSANARAPSAVPNTKTSSIPVFAAASLAFSRKGGTVTMNRAPESLS